MGGNHDDAEQDHAGLTCPECGESLKLDEDWMITDPFLIGTTVGGGESLQGDYAHERCLEGEVA